MKRRKFLKYTGLGVAGASLANNLAFPSTNAVNTPFNSSDIVVIGAGTFGMWTAYHLTNMGAQVTLIDAYGPGNSRASSGGETRLIQCDNDNDIYIRSAIRAFEWWKKVEEDSGQEIVLSTGKLALSQSPEYGAHVMKRQKQHVALGVNNTELLDQDEIKYRWPQIFVDDIIYGMYNDGGPSGSTLLARKGIQLVAHEFVKKGGQLMIAQGKPRIQNGRVEGVQLQDGETLNAQYYVFACGPWLPKIFPELLLPRLRVQRRDVIFVGIPPGDNRYSHPHLPEWSFLGSGYYGFPDIEGRGLKVAPFPDLNSFDPDTDERLISPFQVKRAHEFVRKRFPGMTGQPIIESRVCQLTHSIDSNFIVDQLPNSENTWIIGGGSGHGFKHGPAVGEYAAKRILGEAVDQDYTRDFKLKAETFE